MEDPDQCKLFVGGIRWETTEDTLTEHFGVYGTVVNCGVARERFTGKPRGFAFVSFSDSSAVDAALADASHYILGKKVEVRKATPRREHNHGQVAQRDGSNEIFKTKKIFVGGLPANLTDQEFKAYFEKFGNVTDIVVMHDNIQRPRGFGFVTFDSEEAVDDVLQKDFHELIGKCVEVKRALPKEVNGPCRSRSGGGYYLNNYQQGNYPMYSPNYGVFPRYGPFPPLYSGFVGYPYGASGYGGGYPITRYGGVVYGPQWQGTPLPYGSPVYPAFTNGGVGFMGIAANGYNNGGGMVGHAPTSNSGHVNGGNELVVVENGGNSGLVDGGNEQVIFENGGNCSQVNGGNEQVVIENDGNSSQINGGYEQVVVGNDIDDFLSLAGNCSDESSNATDMN